MFVGKEPISSVQRYDKSAEKTVEMPSPQINQQYNKHMASVDLLDSQLGRHQNKMR